MSALPRVFAPLVVALAAVLWVVPAHAAPTPWCGGAAETSTNRVPDLQLSPNQIHVVYATPSDGPDDFAADAPLIAGDVAAIDAWWRGQDPSRAPRWDLYPFAGCAPGFGQLDISFVRLPGTGSDYADNSTRAPVIDALGGSASSFDVKTLVFYDGPVNDLTICGVSGVAPDSGGSDGLALVWLRACVPDLGNAGVMAWAAAHELLHDLGAEPVIGPPHACPPPHDGHPCDNPLDILYPVGEGDVPLSSAILDAGRDDYYGHSGAWWDVQDSNWLERLPQFELAVSTEGTRGTVVDDTAALSCASACSVAADSGAQVRLAATPRPGSAFVGWKGACTGRGACSLTMDGPKTVTAVFGVATFPFTVSVQGRGRVTGGGVSCPALCKGTLSGGVRARLRATAAAGFRFAGWGGDCHGTHACALSGDRAHRVTARFVRR